MKLVRYGPAGEEKPGLVDDDGRLRDLSDHVIDVDANTLSPRGIARLKGVDPARLPAIEGGPRLGVPVARIGKIIAVGLNYADHAAETGHPLPVEPVLFGKATTSLSGPFDPVVLPRGGEKCDWEVELAIVIGRTASYVSVDDADEYIFGYTIETDVSDRGGRGDGRHGSDWLIGKGHDSYAPLGPFIVPKEFIGDPMNLAIKFTLNDQVMQDSNTGYMWHNVYELVHFASNILTLQPGDVISTGSPSGVGAGRNPPVFMKKGDTAISWIEGIGTLTNPVR